MQIIVQLLRKIIIKINSYNNNSSSKHYNNKNKNSSNSSSNNNSCNREILSNGKSTAMLEKKFMATSKNKINGFHRKEFRRKKREIIEILL